MKAIPTAEQREFASSLRALLSAECPTSLVRALAEPGADRSTPALWKALADAGVFGLTIADEYGGSGGSLDVSRSVSPPPQQRVRRAQTYSAPPRASISRSASGEALTRMWRTLPAAIDTPTKPCTKSDSHPDPGGTRCRT